MLPANDVLRARRRGVSRRPVPSCGRHSRALPRVVRRAGVFTAWLFFLKKPALADAAERSFKWLHTILVDKYGFDWFNEHVIMPAARALGRRPVAIRRSDRDRRRPGQRQRAHRRLAGLGDALRAVGISVSLRVRDDPRIGLAAAVADLAPMMFSGSLAVAIDLAAHRRRLRRAGSGRSRRRSRNGCPWSLAALALLLSVPLWSMVQDRHRRDAIRRARAMDIRPFIRSTTSGSTAFRCR